MTDKIRAALVAYREVVRALDFGDAEMKADEALLEYDARATPALPQGVGEWIENNCYWADTEDGRNSCRVVEEQHLRALLAGKAIVPVEPTEEMTIAAMSAAHRAMPYINDAQKVRAIWHAMLAASTARGNI